MNADTSCGIAVILIVRAAYRPTPEPISAPAMITIQPVVVTVPAWISRTKVAMTAMIMPVVATWLPRRAVAGLFIRCRPTTNNTAVST